MSAVGAVPVTAVVCPSRCQVSQEEHLADLPNWDGHAVHRADREDTECGWRVTTTATTFVDGTLDPESRPDVTVHTTSGLDLTAEGADELAMAVMAAAKEVRESRGLSQTVWGRRFGRFL